MQKNVIYIAKETVWVLEYLSRSGFMKLVTDRKKY